ncbi:speckle-type POZ protein-like [Aphidius gifuensis]|uniref:speckle-type POZ protein-like n=1 Tax=Aphidius gifuensis TaxID=684658 RepID=UPI001CDB5FE5|nr:speckle-type POZ protein-like [Aphidius gifuensis]
MSVVAKTVTHDSIEILMSKQNYLTGKETCKFKYKWTIENFSQLAITEAITSPSFSSHHSDFGDEWILEINQNEATASDDDSESDDDSSDSESDDTESDDPDSDDAESVNGYVSMELQLQSFHALKNPLQLLQAKCKLSIEGRQTITKEHCFNNIHEKISYDKYISRSKLLDLSNRYLKNDKLKICCTITMSKKITKNSAVVSTLNSTSQWSEDWKKLLLNKLSADVTIQVGQKSFHAIKGILAVDHLKNICEDVIGKMINFDNVASILVCSDTYNLKKLNQACSKFMKKNLQVILLNENFKVYKEKHPKVFVSFFEELLLSAKSFR